ncbi:MAG TPA: tetratricopeptide repeat protein [Candidatus Hydrogenedentes bacterium]|nr:tetratricopeptide repeat protein [Candidatus Hydrogenedentota bacterium]
MAFGGESAESYYDEGLTAAMKGDVEQAIALFKQAVQLDSSFLAAFHQLARCYLRTGQSEKAAELLRRVLAINPRLVPPRVDLGFALLELGHAEEARKHFSDAIAIKENDARAHLGLSQCAYDECQWDAATELARAAVNLGGANFAGLFLLGRAARLAGFLEDAAEALTRADALLEKSIESSPEAPEAYYLRGEVCFVKEDYTKALDFFRAAEDRAEPGRRYTSYGETFTRADVLAKRGLCLQHLGRIENARELGEQILLLDPNHRLGAALADLGKEGGEP